MQGQIINGFVLKRLLGEGGMAEVWYAENEIGKPAAVKILFEKLTGNAQIVERFHNEALMMVKLNHQNIRQVYSYGYIGNRHCIVMEYLEGDDLSDLMKGGRRFTDEELRLWWNQIVSALKYTHGQGIVHRDIKPSNLFLDQEGNIKLLDFGIAKIMENSSLTQTGSLMGTLLYMSPEQVKDSKSIDYHTDLYSLAVTFANLLTGKKPYDVNTTSDFEIRERIVYTPFDLSVLPPDWQGFLAPYLEKEPQNRPELRRFEPTPLVKPAVEKTNVSAPPVEHREMKTQTTEIPNASIQQEDKVSPEAPKRKSKAGLFIGLGVGVVAIAAAVVVAILLLKPKEEPPQINPVIDQVTSTPVDSKQVSQQSDVEVRTPMNEQKDLMLQDSVKVEKVKPEMQDTTQTVQKESPTKPTKTEANKTPSKTNTNKVQNNNTQANKKESSPKKEVSKIGSKKYSQEAKKGSSSKTDSKSSTKRVDNKNKTVKVGGKGKK